MPKLEQVKNRNYRWPAALSQPLAVATAFLFWATTIAEAQNYSGSGQTEPSSQSEQSPDSSTGTQSSGVGQETGEAQISPQPADTGSSEGLPDDGNSQETTNNAPLPEAPPAEIPVGTTPIPNADAIPGSSSYTDDMNAGKSPNQSKGNKQLIESLRDVFPVNGNPLKDLFTPQPQYVTPQTLLNPQPTVPKSGEVNPLKGLFTPQPQYITPQTLLNPEPTPPAGEINHFKGVFTAQPQFPTPQTLMNPHPLPRYYVKERLPDHFFEKNTGTKSESSDKAETPLGPSKSSDSVAADTSHPLRQAMLLINSAHEEDAVGLIDRYLVRYPGNFQARYVKAVALVRLRRLGDARTEYKTILQFSSDVALKKLAQEGISKLDE